jgi:hypothetical protein
MTGDIHARQDDERYRHACIPPGTENAAELAWLEGLAEPLTAIERGRLVWLRWVVAP